MSLEIIQDLLIDSCQKKYFGGNDSSSSTRPIQYTLSLYSIYVKLIILLIIYRTSTLCANKFDDLKEFK